jgi:putative acetyltransferase
MKSRAMTSTPDVTIAQESPRQDDVRRLIAALDALMESLYPADSNHLLDIETLCRPDIRFFVARRAGQALGCGALRVFADYAEVKRMFVMPTSRGMKLGRRILDTLEAQARHEKLRFLRLETGISQPEAIGLYHAAGFVERGPFGDYQADPLSIFMEKRL